ncbi:hypothetical protein KQI84_01470 [bacterium]|nr:hypothetical protein [bacterium]
MSVMMMIAILVLVIGGAVNVGGGVWFLVEMFKTNVWWGLGGLFTCGIVPLIWLIMYWKRAWPPFVFLIGGLIPILVGSFVLAIETAGQSSGTF